MSFERKQIRELVRQGGVTALEIGPYTNPICDFSVGNVFSCDTATREALVKRINEDPNRNGHGADNIPETHFIINSDNRFSIFAAVSGRRFDYVISSHNLEHSPNLIQTLLDIEKVLKPGGKLLAFLPDARFCFDRYRTLTTLPDVLESYYEQRSLSCFRNILDHHMHHADNNARRWWKEKMEADISPHKEVMEHSYATAWQHASARMLEKFPTKDDLDALYRKSTSEYMDVHNSTFSSITFKNILSLLISYGYISGLRLEHIGHTKPNQQEFFVLLVRHP